MESTLACLPCQASACNSPLDASIHIRIRPKGVPIHLWATCPPALGWHICHPTKSPQFGQKLLAGERHRPCTSPGHQGLLSPNQHVRACPRVQVSNPSTHSYPIQLSVAYTASQPCTAHPGRPPNQILSVAARTRQVSSLPHPPQLEG